MQARGEERVWRIWVNAEDRVVSFHQESGFQMLEFRSWEYFQAAIDQYHPAAVPLSVRNRESETEILRKIRLTNQ